MSEASRIPTGTDATPAPRVLHIDTEPTFRGGEAQAFFVIEEQARRGDVGLLTPCASPLGRRAAALEGCRVFDLAASSRNSPRNWLALRRAVAAFRPDLLHAHTSHAHALAWLAAPRAIPIVVTRRVDFSIPAGGLRGTKYRSPRVWSVAISRAIEDILLAAGVPADRCFLIPSGIDVARFAAVEAPEARRACRAALLAELHADERATLFGNVAALVDHKGHRFLVEAAARLAGLLAAGRDDPSRGRVHVVVAGEGAERPALEERIAALRLRPADGGPVALHLLGHRDDVPRLLAAFDLFVMPSKLEGLGTTLADALHMELPIVASRVGGIPEIIRDGDNGLLVPPGEPGPLAEALFGLLCDAAACDRLRRRARASLRESPFLAEKMVAAYLALYRRIVARG